MTGFGTSRCVLSEPRWRGPVKSPWPFAEAQNVAASSSAAGIDKTGIAARGGLKVRRAKREGLMMEGLMIGETGELAEEWGVTKLGGRPHI